MEVPEDCEEDDLPLASRGSVKFWCDLRRDQAPHGSTCGADWGKFYHETRMIKGVKERGRGLAIIACCGETTGLYRTHVLTISLYSYIPGTLTLDLVIFAHVAQARAPLSRAVQYASVQYIGHNTTYPYRVQYCTGTVGL